MTGYYEAPEERAERIMARAAEARKRVGMSPGQAATLKALRQRPKRRLRIRAFFARCAPSGGCAGDKT